MSAAAVLYDPVDDFERRAAAHPVEVPSGSAGIESPHPDKAAQLTIIRPASVSWPHADQTAAQTRRP
jgi:hypothetical protein